MNARFIAIEVEPAQPRESRLAEAATPTQQYREALWNIQDGERPFTTACTLPFNVNQHTAQAIAWQLNLEWERQNNTPF